MYRLPFSIIFLSLHQRPRLLMNEKTSPQYCLTGNIGSGKTTVAREFERLGIPVYYADAAAKRLMLEDAGLKAGLIERFGNETYLPDGNLNRTYLAQTAFGNAEALADLNALVHPAVHRDGAKWKAAQRNVPYTLYEAAITLEIGRGADFDGIIVVHAPEAERQRRVLLRDGATARQFAERAAKQWPDEQKVAAADYVILNRGADLLLPQVLHLHAQLTQRNK